MSELVRDVAVRAWAVPDYLSKPPTGGRATTWVDPGPSRWSLTFDTETLTDLSQRLRIGAYQIRQGDRLRREGLFYDAEAITDSELQVIAAYAEAHGLELLDRARFVDQVFFPITYKRRGLLVGFNLPYDLARLAVAHATARAGHASQPRRRSPSKAMRGGFTFKLSENPFWPRIQIKRVGTSAAFIRFATPDGRHPEARNREKGGTAQNHRGYIVDVATLAKSLLGGRWSLKKLAETLNTDHQKQEIEGHGQQITPEYLDYARTDVQVTWECHTKLAQRYATYALKTPAHRVFSEASIGKAHLRDIGLTSWRESQPDVPREITAAIMETYYGGRSECVIRRVAIPGVYLDFTSQYPTVFVLQGLWLFLTSRAISWSPEDPAIVQRQLDNVTIRDVLDPDTWRSLHALVLVQPDGDRLPTRAAYRPSGSGPLTVGRAIRRGGPAQWWCLADCIASKLETAKAPRVLGVIRFAAREQQPGLQVIEVAGNPDYRVDPYTDDLIKRLIELRATTKAAQVEAEQRGDLETAAQLEAIQQGMKITANATAYGIPIEINVVEHRTKVPVTIYRPDGTSYRTRTKRTEEPGRYFHPLVATLVASGGRLLLESAITLGREAGGRHVMCDTDGLFIAATPNGSIVACPGGDTRLPDGREALTTATWDAITGEVVAQFEALNPYDRGAVPGSVLKMERENFHPDTGEQREIECFSIAAKRYAIFAHGADGRPAIVGRDDPKRSRHGLGHLLRPTTAEADWITEWWTHLICIELRVPSNEPTWFGDIAAGALTVTTPHEERLWDTYNHRLPYQQRVRPWNFAMTAHPTRLYRSTTGPRSLTAPLQDTPAGRRTAAWLDRHDQTGVHYRACTANTADHIPGAIQVLTYSDYFHEYRSHPEHKALSPDGRSCHAWTRGLLQSSSVAAAARLLRIGKESLPTADDDPDPSEPPSPEIVYADRRCTGCGTGLTDRQIYCSDRCRKRESRRTASLIGSSEAGDETGSGVGIRRATRPKDRRTLDNPNLPSSLLDLLDDSSQPRKAPRPI
jgi:hypothetical protein